VGILAYFGLHVTMSYRIRFLLEKMQSHVGFGCVLASHMGGMIAGDVTPGRSGYFLTSKLLNRCGCKTEKGLAAIVAPQGIEFLIKGLGAGTAAIYLIAKSGMGDLLPVFLSGIVVLVLGAFAFLGISWLDEQKSRKFVERIPYLSTHVHKLDIFKDHSAQIKPYILQIMVLSVVGWFFVGMQWYFVGKSVGLELSFLDYFLLHPLITTLAFVPVTPAGLGIMEGGAVLALYLLGIDPGMALVFTVLARINSIIGDLPGLYFLLKSLKSLNKSIKIKNKVTHTRQR
jgi:uncharacterized protein (TIRG00374 family)